jgi:hypothetical protein
LSSDSEFTWSCGTDLQRGLDIVQRIILAQRASDRLGEDLDRERDRGNRGTERGGEVV